MFPFNFRLALAGWKNLFFEPQRFTPDFDVLGRAMGEVVTDETAEWSEQDLAALAAFLMGKG